MPRSGAPKLSNWHWDPSARMRERYYALDASDCVHVITNRPHRSHSADLPRERMRP
jgi:hypothetical protein